MQASSTNVKVSDIVAPILNAFDPTVARPTTSSLHQIVRRVRKKESNMPPLPLNAADFQVPESLKNYSGGLF